VGAVAAGRSEEYVQGREQAVLEEILPTVLGMYGPQEKPQYAITKPNFSLGQMGRLGPRSLSIWNQIGHAMLFLEISHKS
jgi:hypothetical protein